MPATTASPRPLQAISSMATRAVLGELAEAWQAAGGAAVAIESVGGVDAARRVQAGEPFDAVILAADALERLIAGGHVRPGSRVDLVRSPVAVAVRAGAPRPDITTEAALRQAVLQAPTIGYSTGPSGQHLGALFERWGLADALRERIVVPPPGLAVGRLIAEGRVALGFQQLSELQGLDGVQLLGLLPPGTEFITTFSGGVCAACSTSDRADAVRAMLAHMAAPAADEAKRRHGMGPARD